jgi:hypothetical protein
MKQLFLRFERWTTTLSMMVACLMMALASAFALRDYGGQAVALQR